MEVALKIKSFKKKYWEFTAVKGIDLDVKKGEVFGFLGPNGEGKPQPLKSVPGFSAPAREVFLYLVMIFSRRVQQSRPNWGMFQMTPISMKN